MKLVIKVTDRIIDINYNEFVNVSMDISKMQEFMDQAEQLASLLNAEAIPTEAKEMLVNIISIYNKVLMESHGIFTITLDEATGDLKMETMFTFICNINDIKQMHKSATGLMNFDEDDYQNHDTQQAERRAEMAQAAAEIFPEESSLEYRLDHLRQRLNSLLVTNDGSLYDASQMHTLRIDILNIEELIKNKSVETNY